MKIAFIGDSYTAGFLLPDSSQRWSSALCRSLGADEINVARSGSGFMVKGTGATFVEQAQDISINHKDSDVVFVAGGHNDAESGISITLIEAQVRKTYQTLRASMPTAKIYVATFWHYLQPSERIMAVDALMTRVGAEFGAEEVTNSVVWRVNRRDWSYDDGHPNPAGATAMASLVKSQKFESHLGFENYGRFVRPIQQDSPFSGTANVAEGTIFNARPGLWRLVGRETLYGPAGGWSYVSYNANQILQRADLTSTPTPISRNELVVHSGGDLRITIGYTAAHGIVTVIGSGAAAVEATFES